MPVTIEVASHPVEGINLAELQESLEYSSTSGAKREPGWRSAGLLQHAAPQPSKRLQRVLQSTTTDEIAGKILPQMNGLVHTCLIAYNHHHHLVLRPDDIWIAIVTQFSFYVNKHAEELRSFFVMHKDKKELIVEEGITRGIDFARMTAKMADTIQVNVVGKDLQAWIIPAFSTTTEIDTIVCSAIMMGTMKEYFSYKFSILCGIPSVTLLGEVSDWETILQRLDKLRVFGSAHKQLEDWRNLLAPVIQNMIKCFYDPETQADFWSRIAHYKGGGSGPTYLSGWITAFCVFTEKGKWQGGGQSHPFESGCPQLSLTDSLTGETISYSYIDVEDVPPGWCEVDVKIELNLTKIHCVVNAVMVAGLVGASVFSLHPYEEILNTVQPFPAWWIFTVDSGNEEDSDGGDWR